MLKLLCTTREGLARVGSHPQTIQLLMEFVSAPLAPEPSVSLSIDRICVELLDGLAHVINLKVAPGKKLLSTISLAISAQKRGDASSAAVAQRYALVHLVTRLADCPHNKQVCTNMCIYMYTYMYICVHIYVYMCMYIIYILHLVTRLADCPHNKQVCTNMCIYT